MPSLAGNYASDQLQREMSWTQLFQSSPALINHCSTGHLDPLIHGQAQEQMCYFTPLGF